jgi:allantoinase
MEKKPYGPFPYIPITQRPKLTWPDGAHVALWVIPNIEAFPLNYGMPGDQNERPEPNPKNPHVRQWAQRDYGNRVGVWRIMEVLSKYGIRATPSLNSNVCDIHPQIIEAGMKLGWEFMGHCQTNCLRLTEVPPEQEKQVIHDTLARIEQAAGKKPVGWLGAGLQETWNTLDYLVEEGCIYVADWINDDQPYLMNINGKRLVSLPYSFETNDTPAFLSQKYTAGEFQQMICRQFDTLYREGAESGRVMAIALHPYITGVPHRITALDAGLDYICQHEKVWKATGQEIVRYYLDFCEAF